MTKKAVNCTHQLMKGVLIIMMVNEICEKKYNKPLSGCTNKEIYYALLDMTKNLAAKKESEAGKKKVYYISAEFLIGKLLSNNLINLGLYKTVKEEVDSVIARAQEVMLKNPMPEYCASLFHPDSLAEVLKMAELFSEMSDYLKACFVGAIALTARGCNQYKWTSSTVGKNIEPKRYIPFYDKFRLKAKKHYYPIPNDSVVYFNDTRLVDTILAPNSIDYIFSSPPYFDCLDYTAYYARFVYEILGYDRMGIKDTLIQDFGDYRTDMKKVLDGLYNVLKPGGQVIFVVGDKKVHGKIVNGADFFNEISPFKHIETIERSYSGTSSQVFDQLNNTSRKEQIVIWQK